MKTKIIIIQLIYLSLFFASDDKKLEEPFCVIDDVSYFLEINGGHVDISSTLMELDDDAYVTALSVSIPGVVERIFRTNDGRATIFRHTVKQNTQWREIKSLLPSMYESMVPEVVRLREGVVRKLNEACYDWYSEHLPLNSIEMLDEDTNIYLIFGIAQKGPIGQDCLESICIQLRLQDNYPECCIDWENLSRYHCIYSYLNSYLNSALSKSGRGVEFAVRRYTPVPDVVKVRPWWGQVERLIDYLQQNELDPVIYIPTYQHNALINNSYALLPFGYKGNNLFATERVHGLEYSLDVEGIDSRFMLSELSQAEVNCLQISYKIFGTEFLYEMATKIPGTMVEDHFRDALEKIKEVVCKFVEIGVSHPVSSIIICREKGSRYLDLVVDANAPRLEIKLAEDEADNKYLTKENLLACHKLHAELKQILDPDVEPTDIYVEVPEVLQKQESWSYMQRVLDRIAGASVMIQKSQREELIDKSYLLLSFCKRYSDKAGFDTEIADGIGYHIESSGIGSHKSFKIAEVEDSFITSFWIDLYAPAPGKFRQWKGDTKFEYDSLRGLRGMKRINEGFKFALKMGREMRDTSIRCLEQIKDVEFPLSYVCYSDEPGTNFLNIIASDEGRKLNPKFIESEGPWIRIPLPRNDPVDKLLTEKYLKIYRDICELIKTNVRKMLEDTNQFDKSQAFNTFPKSVEKEPFWEEVAAMIKEVNDKLEIKIPEYQCQALDEIMNKRRKVPGGYSSLRFSDENEVIEQEFRSELFLQAKLYGIEGLKGVNDLIGSYSRSKPPIRCEQPLFVDKPEVGDYFGPEEQDSGEGEISEQESTISDHDELTFVRQYGDWFKGGMSNGLEFKIIPSDQIRALFPERFSILDAAIAFDNLVDDSKLEVKGISATMFVNLPAAFAPKFGKTEIEFYCNYHTQFENLMYELDQLGEEVLDMYTEIYKLLEVVENSGIAFPISRIRLGGRHLQRQLHIVSCGRKLNREFNGSEGPEISLLLKKDPLEKFFSKEHLKLYKSICNLTRRSVRLMLKDRSGFTKSQGFFPIPTRVGLKNKWYTRVKTMVKQIAHDADVSIPCYQYEALLDQTK